MEVIIIGIVIFVIMQFQNGSRRSVSESWPLIIGVTLVAAFLLVYLILASNKPAQPSSGSASRSETVFESATRKIDKGRADELTPAEAQSIHDAMNPRRK